jgi:hypothetical protein
MDNAREAAICFNHDTVLRRKFQDVPPRRVVVRVEVDLRKKAYWFSFTQDCAQGYDMTWFTAGTTFPVLTIRCNHSRVKLLTPMLLVSGRDATLNKGTRNS